jgi:hypothetical protein
MERCNGLIGSSRLLQQNRHVSDMPTALSDVRFWGAGKHLLAASISPFDPEWTCDTLNGLLVEAWARQAVASA